MLWNINLFVRLLASFLKPDLTIIFPFVVPDVIIFLKICLLTNFVRLYKEKTITQDSYILLSMNQILRPIIRALISIGIMAMFCVLVVVLYTNAQLPPVDVLEDIQLQVPLKIYTADGQLIGEYGEKRRTPVSINEIPEKMKLAVLATEDRRFYQHNGVDLRGLMRAGVHLIVSGTKGQGASTITMQVARNFFLTRKKTFSRKLHEVLLALKIEKELSKDQILELYLNKIYFGKRAYGVQAAAQVYYGTTIDKLTLAQMAMIAGLPQAPSALNPINNPTGALKRRAHVLNRMLYYDFISETEYEEAVKAPLTAKYHSRYVDFEAPFIAEMARQQMIQMYGPKAYTSGFVVYTTVDSKLQSLAQFSLQQGLLEYDKRHGYRGPLEHWILPDHPELADAQTVSDWSKKLNSLPAPSFQKPALVLSIHPQSITALLANQERITIPLDSMKWAKKQLTRLRLGSAPTSPDEVVEIGDVIYAEPEENQWLFSQKPDVQGALVSLHPKNGSILALVGGARF